MVVWLYRRMRRLRAERSLGFAFVAALVALSLVGNAACFLYFEGPTNPELGIADALWYSVISITTIGYGDFYATTTGARIGTIVFIVLLGLSSFTLLLGMLVDWVTDTALKGQRGMAKIISKDHVLVINYPGEARIRQIVKQLLSDPDHAGQDIVLVTDQVTELPIAYENLFFVHGSPLEASTLEQAAIRDAREALVLATSYESAMSDAIVSACVSVIAGIKPEVHIVAECLRRSHRNLFDASACDAVVPVLSIGGNLLVQAVHDPGVARTVDSLTSNLKGQTLFSTALEADLGRSVLSFAQGLLASGINVVALQRGEDCLTQLSEIEARKGDKLVYVASERKSWSELTSLGS